MLKKELPIKKISAQSKKFYPLTERERAARKAGLVTSAISKPYYSKAHTVKSAVDDWTNSRLSYSMDKVAYPADIEVSQMNSFYSPQLSTDYLQLPKSVEERRSWYRFWYANNEIVGRAIDLHSTLPLSKIKLTMPKGSDKETNEYILDFYQRMEKRLNLFQRLLEISHDYWLLGDVFVFFEDDEDNITELDYPDDYTPPNPGLFDKMSNTRTAAPEDEEDPDKSEEEDPDKSEDEEDPDKAEEEDPDKSDENETPKELLDAQNSLVDTAKKEIKKQKEKPQPIPWDYFETPIKQYKQLTPEERLKNLKINLKNFKYKGWSRMIILPPDDVRITTYPFTDKVNVELLLNPEARKVFNFDGQYTASSYSNSNIFPSEDIIESVPDQIMQNLREGSIAPLNIDPYQGSFVCHLARKKSQYEALGSSLLDRCQRTLLYSDKLRQSQTQIANRHMTPIRSVWAAGLGDEQLQELRAQVEQALEDPDYSIVLNYELNWNEMGSRDRLLDLTSENELIQNLLFMGLGVTKELMTGEGTFSGNRVSLEIMNTLYMNYREIIANFIEETVFKPVAVKKGFYEIDKWGNKKYLYPGVSFTRLSLRDNTETYEQLFNLYNKGSLPIDLILEVLGIDPDDAKKKMERDLFTVNDPVFNELIRGIYSKAADLIGDKTDISDRIAKYLSLNFAPPEQSDEDSPP